MADSKGPRKRSKAYYSARPAKRKKRGLAELSPGMQGLLITSNDQEKLCVSEAYNLLNEYADKLYGPEVLGALGEEGQQEETEETEKEEEVDIAAAVAREVEGLKGKGGRERRFQACASGAKYVVFIRCREPVEPCQLVHFMLNDLSTSGVKKSRFCLRMVPVVKVCHASLAEIEKEAVSVLAPHFHQDDLQEHTFAVNYKSRNNSELKRDDVIRVLATMVTRNGDFSHRVDLTHPELTVMVEIVKNLCCLSVVKDFHKLRRYNVQSVMEGSSEKVATTQKRQDTAKQEASPLGTSNTGLSETTCEKQEEKQQATTVDGVESV